MKENLIGSSLDIPLYDASQGLHNFFCNMMRALPVFGNLYLGMRKLDCSRLEDEIMTNSKQMQLANFAEEIIKCGICLETYSYPKTLKCLHTFAYHV